jgi:hypothetical protein
MECIILPLPLMYFLDIPMGSFLFILCVFAVALSEEQKTMWFLSANKYKTLDSTETRGRGLGGASF